MILQSRIKYETPKDRKELARKFKNIISGDERFQPYNSNENDDMYWTVDPGNDWHLTFLEDTTKFRISFRHESEGSGKEMQLFTWLKVNFGFKLVTE